MSVMRWANLTPLKTACHSEPFACHSERSEESPQFAQGKLREESRSGPETMRDSSLRSE